MTDQLTYDVRTLGCQMNVHDSERLVCLPETTGHVDLAGPSGFPACGSAAPRSRDRGDV